MGTIGGNALARPVTIRSVGAAPLTIGATSGTRGERGPGADVALAKTFAIGELLESRDTLLPKIFDPSARLGDGDEHGIAGLGSHGRDRGGGLDYARSF